MAGSLSHTSAGVSGFLRREFEAMWPVFLFFLIGFLLLFLLIKLALAQFAIEVTAISNAVVGALIAAKAALVLDGTPLARSLESYRRIVAVAVKTFCYGVAFLLVGCLERLVEARGKVHSFAGAVAYMINHEEYHRLLAWSLGVGIVFGLYFALVEINRQMGKGELGRLFFSSPQTIDASEPLSKVNSGNR